MKKTNILAVAFMALALAACGGDDGTTETPDAAPEPQVDGGGTATVTYADVQAIWDASCATSGCHVAPSATASGNLDLSAANSYAALVDVDSTQATGVKRVVAGDLDASYLWNKLQDTQGSVGGEGAKMPLGGTLTAEQLATIEAWITGGAMQ